jgi:hypothetical protein
MGTISNYILDGETVATSTTVSNTNGTPAATGWYKDSSGVRYATNGYFLSGPAVDCDCTETCSDPSGAPTTITRPTGTVSEDHYEFTTGQNTGVSLVRFTPNNVPVGIAVGFSSPGALPNTWGNTLSPFEHTRIASGPFFLGNSADDFGLAANSPWTNITDREYYNGTWSNTGNFSAYYVSPASLSLYPYNPGTLVLPVSKSTTGSMSIYIAVTSLDTACTYSLSVTCPQVIPEAYRYLRTSEGFNCNNSVIFPLPTYLLSPSGAIAPSQGDFLFSDNLGQNPVSDGTYVMHRTGVDPNTQKYLVEVSNGVVIYEFLCIP